MQKFQKKWFLFFPLLLLAIGHNSLNGLDKNKSAMGGEFYGMQRLQVPISVQAKKEGEVEDILDNEWLVDQIRSLKEKISSLIKSQGTVEVYTSPTNITIDKDGKLPAKNLIEFYEDNVIIGSTFIESIKKIKKDDTLLCNVEINENYNQSLRDKLENAINSFIYVVKNHLKYEYIEISENPFAEDFLAEDPLIQSIRDTFSEKFPSPVLSSENFTSYKPVVPLQQKQTLHRASVWNRLSKGRPLTKGIMIADYIGDCKKSSDQNQFIPKHEKNINSLRVMTYNVFEWNSPDDKANFEGILNVIKDINPDILILQEARNEGDKITALAELGYTGHTFCDAKAYWTRVPFGNMVFSKYPIIKTENAPFIADKKSKNEEQRCYVKMVINLPNEKQVTVFGAHLDIWDPSGALAKAEIQELIDQSRNIENVIIAADFNSVRTEDYNYVVEKKKVWNILSKISKNRTGYPPATSALHTLQNSGFVDSFTRIGFQSPKFTVWSGTAVDFIFVNRDFNLPVLGSYLCYSSASDHLPVIMDVKLS